MNNTTNQQNEDGNLQQNRSIRVFVSSTFKDMIEDRNELMTHTWPELRRFCRERQVELVEVDLRWGIAEEQSTRKETLKLCLDEIRACRPFFIGLLGERYGWVPGDDVFNADLEEEQPWLKNLHGKSVTELEILHGVLNNPEMAGRSFFYFRDPAYAQQRGTDFLSENDDNAKKQTLLKNLIRKTCNEKNIPLKEDYSNPGVLAALVLEQLKAAIEAQFPKETIPDSLTREARDHEAFAEIRRRTYIGRPDYFEALDNHCMGNEKPLLLLGESGSGKSALVANWIEHWRKEHSKDFIFQHYIGGTTDSAVHWKLMTRLMAEIKRWCEDPEELPRSNDDILRDFPLWLSKARIKAERDGVRFIIILDALNQLEDKDNGRLLGWLPTEPFRDNLRLIVSTLPGVTLEVLEKRSLALLHIEPLTPDERGRMIAEYLRRFGKALDKPRIERLSNTEAAANPLYLKILLDELRVTGTHDRLDERLDDYLKAQDIPMLLQKVLTRYQQDYEHDRKGLVSQALGLLWSARRGLTETELLQLLRPDNLPQLPLATWTPLRAALEESLVDRGGILNFAHDFLRSTVETAFLPDLDKKDDFQIILADYFEDLPPTARSCDELPWLLWQTELFKRLRACLLNIDCFLEMLKRDKDELHAYWVYLNEERSMGKSYLDSFNVWSAQKTMDQERISYATNELGAYLYSAALHTSAESLYRLSLKINTEVFGEDHPNVATSLNNLAVLLKITDRPDEAEPLMKRMLKIDEAHFGKNHPSVSRDLNNLAQLFRVTNRLDEAEPLFRRSLKIDEDSLGKDHPYIARDLSNLACLLSDTNRIGEAESLHRRALKIVEERFGRHHPKVAVHLMNVARMLQISNHIGEAESLMKRALKINEASLGNDHPEVARDLNNLAQLLQDSNRVSEVEPLIKRSLKINEDNFGKDHPNVAISLNNLATLYCSTNRMEEAEPLLKRALEIVEISLGNNHPKVATTLNNLAQLLKFSNRLDEAEPLLKRALKINEDSYGKDHPNVAISLNNLASLFQSTGRPSEAEPLHRRALKINVESYGKDHPNTATSLNHLAEHYRITKRFSEAEPLYRRALKINEDSYGKDHQEVGRELNNLALLLEATNRLSEAEPLSRRTVEILINFTRTTGHPHPNLQTVVNNYTSLLKAMGWSKDKITARVKNMAPEIFNK